MAGLNAVPVAEHAVALLLALARRLPEAAKGFEPGRLGGARGRSLSGTAACIVGAGAVGTQIARRLAAFDVTVTGLRRRLPAGPAPPFAAVYGATASSMASPRSTPSSSQPNRPASRPLLTTPCSEPCAQAPGSSILPAAPSSTPTPPRPTEHRAPRRPGSRRVCDRPYPGDGPLPRHRASWRPPTPPPSRASTSQPLASVSATPSPATSIISHPRTPQDEPGTNPQWPGRGHPDTERKPRERRTPP